MAVNALKNTVYILHSEVSPWRWYTGLTSGASSRLAAHNAALSTHTASGRPWTLVVLVQFADATKAEAFDVYLKSGSGRAFVRRHFRWADITWNRA